MSRILQFFDRGWRCKGSLIAAGLMVLSEVSMPSRNAGAS
jgi:hypothetical protein